MITAEQFLENGINVLVKPDEWTCCSEFRI